MAVFEATLVRERITLVERAGDDTPAHPAQIRSTRLHLSLPGRVAVENIVIRSKNMHTTLRVAAKVLFSYYKSGIFANRAEPYDWENMWDLLLTGYDRKFNPELWAAVYIDGKLVFRAGATPALDVVEQCAALTYDNYDATIALAKKALGQDGLDADIEHLVKVAAVFSDDDTQLRCGVIHRADGKDMTFSFTAQGGEQYSRVVQGFNIAASFLEAIDILHFMRMVQRRLRAGEITRADPDMTKYNASPQRLKDLRRALEAFEEHFGVRYRPEKPDVFAPPKESL